MTIEVKVPVLPESVEDATIAGWHRQPGDTIHRDENLVDLETDKVVLEVPAPVDGTVRELLAAEGDTVHSDDLSAIIEEGVVEEGAAEEEPSEEEPPSEEEEKAEGEDEEEAEPELDENGEPIVVKEPLYFKESDFHLRVPHENFNHIKTLETTAMSSVTTPLSW